MLKEMKNLVAFLTIVPVGMDQDYLRDTAKYMPLFPLVGVLTGSMAGLLAWLLSYVLPDLIIGVLALGFILLMTGLHHTDGLLDFGDGVMYQGPAEKKIEIMHDQQTGAGGLSLGLVTLLTTAFCIAELKRSLIIQSLVVSEVLAKLAMVLGAWLGRSAHKGMNTPFVEGMHGEYRKLRLGVALTISLGITLPLLRIAGFVAIISAFIASLIMVDISQRHFRGVTGDVFGAMNEIIRMVSLITILVAVKWV